MYRSNKRFKPTANAWHFWFAGKIVFKAQCGSRCIALAAA
ncbi:DUF3265 domain-containing protein [Vibrio sp. vnigr-6D03]|nr:DUF3265 domain-containing protein [Vibrio sp. vnigr-6D03]PKF78881.1 DUF3265 domain-containing protein [Vibrio sp. vnigr-6D03]